MPFAPASLAVAAKVIVPAPTCIEVALAAKASVEPLINTGIFAENPPAVAVTVAVRLLKSDAPLDKITVAFPAESDVAVRALKLPLDVEKVTIIPCTTALNLVTVAVNVAEVELSVLIEVTDVANEIASFVTVVVPPEVLAVDAPPAPHPARIATTIASNIGIENLIISLTEKRFRTLNLLFTLSAQ